MIKMKKHEPTAYRIYDYLKQNCVGKENAISGRELSEIYGIDRRQLRRHIHTLRNSAEMEKVIGSCNRGYYICREEDFDEADKRLERQALSTLKVVWANRKKRSKDGQYKLPLGDYYTQIFEAFGE
ncbi:MAG: helix-turn-helix domain-containing protein [Roseburia sp.]|nr:helix-turn-helix domain-containing protein [Roseburia sp.]